MEKIKKIIKQADLRKLQNYVDTGVITESRFIEIINDLAYFEYKLNHYQKTDDKEPSTDSKIEYMRRWNQWSAKKYTDSFERGMMEPTRPNAMYANTH